MDGREGRGLVKRHAFGLRNDVRNCLNWLDDGTLMYPVGKAIALHTLSTNGQRFLEAGYQSAGVTAMAVSSNKKFVAIAEGGENPQIQIIDTVTRKRRKVLSVADPGSDRFVAMTFSADGRHLVTQGGAPGWNLYYWNWERSKPLASLSLAATAGLEGTAAHLPEAEVSSTSHQNVKGGAAARNTPRKGRGGGPAAGGSNSAPQLVTEVAICPADSLMITVSGIGLMRYYKFSDGMLQPMPSCGYAREQQEVFVTHRWITSERLVAAMKRGGIILIDRGQYLHTVEDSVPSFASSTSYANEVVPMVTAIVPTRNGFVAGTDRGEVSVFEIQDESVRESGYYLACTLQVPMVEPGETLSAATVAALGIAAGSSLGVGATISGGGTGSSSTGAGAIVKEAARAAAAAEQSGKSAPNMPSTYKRRFQVNSAAVLSSVSNHLGQPQHQQLGQHQLSGTHSAGAAGDSRPLTSDGAVASVGMTGSRQGKITSAGSAPMYFEETGFGFGVSCLALDQSEENLALATRAGKIYAVDFRQNWNKIDLSKGPAFESVCQPFHTGKIVGMDCSVRKPFLITTSTDRSVRVWNTSTNKQEICQFFKLEPGAVAIHPNGLMAVVCFPDKVRVLSILWNSLRERCGINFRNAADVKFAHGGQFFAIMHGNLVDIFNSATCELHGQLRGHPQRIKDMQWCSTTPYPTDNRIVTCSIDGMLVDWSITEMRKEAEHSDKRYQYMATASDDRNVWTVAAPTSSMALEVNWRVTLREMDRHGLNVANTASEDYEFSEAALTCLTVAPHQRMLFGGADDGSVKVMTFPLQAGVQEAPLSAHHGKITKMVLSFDETTLYTASSDGSFFIWDVREEGMRQRVHDTGSPSQTDEVLVTQREIEERKIEMDMLRQQIEKLKTDIDSEEKRRNHEQGARVRERAEEFKSDAAALSTEYATLWNTKSEQERSFVAIKLEKESEAARAMEKLERTRQREVQELEDMCSDLQHTLEVNKIQHAGALENTEATIEREVREDAERFDDILSQRREALEKLTRQVDRSLFTNKETLHQLELDTDAESQSIYNRNNGDLRTLRERFLHMKGDGAIMRKNALRIEKEIEVRASEVRLLDSAKAALSAQLSDLSHQISQLHQDIDERDAVIGEKEKRIYALKKQNQELEKHKFVLDHRIRQLKAQMEPKQREIVQHNQRITLKNRELEALHENNITLYGNIDELKTDLLHQQQHIKQLLNRMKDFQTYKSRVQKDVGELAAALQEPAQLRDIVSRLYQNHVIARGGQRIAQAEPQIKQEFADQLQFLSTSVEALRRKVKADQERNRKEVSDMMVENLALIREIHELRGEIAQLRTYVAADEALRRAQGTRKAKRASNADASTDAGVDSSFAGGGPAASTRSATSSQAASRSRVPLNASGNRLPKLKPPAPPRAIEDNRTEIRMLRAYVDAMERALGDAARPTSSSMRLPPVSSVQR